MTKQEFINAKLNSFKPTLSFLIMQKEAGLTSNLIEFVQNLHPKQAFDAQGTKLSLYGRKFFVFTIYESGVLKTDVEAGVKTFYPIKF